MPALARGAGDHPLTTFDDDASVFDGLRADALGYLLKDVSGHELAEAVRKVAAGGALIEPCVPASSGC